MHLLAPMWAVTVNTLRETVRDRVLYAFVFFALIMTLAGVLLGSLSVYQDDRILQDIGLFTISTIGGIIAIFVGTSLVYKEVDRRTIYLIYSKPISRWQFVCGKFLGLSLCVLIVTLLMGLFLVGTIIVTAHPRGAETLAQMAPTMIQVAQAMIPLMVVSLALIYLELLLVIAMATFFSTFSTPLMSVLFTLALWLCGHMGQSLLLLSRHASNAGVKMFFAGIYNILPDLAHLTQMRSDFMYPPHQLPQEAFVLVTVYVLAYIVILLSLATVITENREIQ